MATYSFDKFMKLGGATTPDQIKSVGVNTTPPPKTESFGADTFSDFKQIGSDIISGSQKRADKIQAIKGKMQSGEKGDIPAILETSGQLAGAGADAISAVIKGAFKMVLPPRAEAKTKEIIQKFGTKVVETPAVQSIVKWYADLPDSKKDAVDASLGAVDLATQFIGLGAAKKGLNVVKEGAEGALETGGKILKKGSQLADDATKSTQLVIKDIIPGADRIVNTTVSKALNLTPGDISNISKSTGNEVGQFIAKHNLIGKNLEETTKLVDDFYKTNYNTVREEIAKVPTLYHAGSVPRYTDALNAIKKAVNDVPGMEEVSLEVDNILSRVNKNAKDITLNDVQRVKELMDDHFSLYKVTGDVKENVAKEGLANMRKDLKEFIEQEVKKSTGADIKDLNNKTMTSRSIKDAIKTRAPKGITASNISIGDFGTFGVGSMFGGPLVGAAALVAKKIIESPSAMLRFAKWIDSISDARKLKVIETLQKGEVPKEIEKFIEP